MTPESPDWRVRPAERADLPRIVALLAHDPLGATRESGDGSLSESYVRAFDVIQADPGEELVVCEDRGAVVGTLQLSVIPSLTYRGGTRAQIEGVRVAESHRGRGVGRFLFDWAIRRARERGCHLLQLTTDKARPDAIAFYEALGFVASHEGMKRKLSSGNPPPRPG